MTTRANELIIPDVIDETKLWSLDDVKKHFTEAEIVEMCKRYIAIRWMQKKARRVQMEKLKLLKQFGREQGVWGKKADDDTATETE